MKRIVLSMLSCAAFLAHGYTQVKTDTVSLGAGYAQEKWYSLENDEQGVSPKVNWDLAFDTGGYATSIRINSPIGVALYPYPKADTSGWASVDTTGIKTWKTYNNSETSWSVGAFDRGVVATNQFDVGWGVYNSVTHIITGDSLFVIKLADGSFKKLWIKDVSAGAYHFIYADLNGNNQKTGVFTKADYAGKNFGYYSLANNAALNREPASASWDFTFTQYTGLTPAGGGTFVYYTLTGLLSNKGVTVAQANNIGNAATYKDYGAHTFNADINEIGSDWKVFSGSWSVTDSLVYFVKSKPGDLWKVIFTGFGGSGNGNFIFTKEKLSAVGIEEIDGTKAIAMSVYPNPSAGTDVNLVYDLAHAYNNASVSLIDLSGRMVYAENVPSEAGLRTLSLPTSGLQSGTYILNLVVDGNVIQQKVAIAN